MQRIILLITLFLFCGYTNAQNIITNNGNLQIHTGASVSGFGSFNNTSTAALVNNGNLYIKGDIRHVNGWVKKMGSSDFIFPVGDETVERTVALSSLSANSEFNAKYFANTPFPYQLQDPVREVTQPEYWAVNKVSVGPDSVT